MSVFSPFSAFSPVIHQEPLRKVVFNARTAKGYVDTSRSIDVGDVEAAQERSTSWVRRNQREWPHNAALDFTVNGDVLDVRWRRVEP